jgi:hypothetical protein
MPRRLSITDPATSLELDAVYRKLEALETLLGSFIQAPKVLGGGTTKASPGTVSAWQRVNVGGVDYFVPMYTSTTS